MAVSFQNTTGASTATFNKGMLTDTDVAFTPDGVWTYARNAVNNSDRGQVGVIGNEQANRFCNRAPYTVIGVIYIEDDKWVLFSTDDVNSEIGIFDESECSYTKVVNDRCLNFKQTNLISGVIRSNFDCTKSVYFADGLNPDRVLNLDNPPYIKKPKKQTQSQTCADPEYTTDLDCEALRIAPLLDPICLSLSNSDSGGSMPNGSYQVVAAYTVNNIRVTDYFMPSNVQSLFSHANVAGGLEVEISSIDLSFDEFELVLISTVAANAVSRSLGFYSTKSRFIAIDRLDDTLPVVNLTDIPLQTPAYEKSDAIFEVNGYLLRSGIYTKFDFNYQPIANQIVTRWVSAEVPADYYIKGGNQTSYMRDEVYSFFIRWVYNTGDKSASYHIPGRAPQGRDLANATGPDAIENATQDEPVKVWEVEDTSQTTSRATYVLPNGDGTVIAEGLMSYWESTEAYPDDNSEIWGDLCGRKIRHHKFPDNCTTHINSADGTRINLLGVKFENIRHPLDNNGNPIESIIGYEILRGSREGNKTVIAKGLLNNMGEYDIDEDITSRKGLYANYPFNDLRTDPFLSKKPVRGGCAGKDYEAMGTFKKDVFSFHSPETQFKDPYLNPYELKIHGELFGQVNGKFEPVYNHPEFKALRDLAVFTAAVIGTGIGLIAASGEKTTLNVSDRTLDVGLDVNAVNSGGTLTVLTKTGKLGSTTDYSKKQSPVTANLVQSVALQAAGGFLFVTFLGQGMEATMKILESLIPYEKFAYQYNAHGFYTNFACPRQNNRRRRLEDAQYINPYLQEFGPEYRINNLYRNRIVSLRTAGEIENPTNQDNSRVTIGNLGLWETPGIPFLRTTSAHYASLKIKMRNQYGQLPGIIQVPVSTCVHSSTPNVDALMTSPVLFGGDIYINRYTEKNSFFFYNDWLFGQEDGFQYNYLEHVNIPYPRYWMNTQQYDYTKLILPFAAGVGTATLSSLVIENKQRKLQAKLKKLQDGITALSGDALKNAQKKIDKLIDKIKNIENIEGTVNTAFGIAGAGAVAIGTWKNKVLPNDYRYLDRSPSNCRSKVDVGISDAYFYLFANGIRDFFVESEINLAQRDYGEELSQQFYDPYNNTDLSTLFRSDIIKSGNYYKYDFSLSISKLFTNNFSWGTVLPADYNPKIAESCYSYYSDRIIYSLPQNTELKKDNWRVFLVNNYRDFDSDVSTVKGINTSGAMILLKNSSPVVFPGVDQLQTQNGIKVTIGDGGLFTGNIQNVFNSEYVYEQGACESRFGALSTPLGLFWVSQGQGKVFSYTNGLKEISRQGMKWWFAKYLPSNLLSQFPDFQLKDNPILGVGVQLAYDNTNEILYISKKDYRLKDEYVGQVTYLSENKFKLGNRDVYLWDSTYFDNASFTISYDPKADAWISFHDWNPDLSISSKSHFMTIKGREVWKHNDRCDLYCNFYNVDYPFEVEYVESTGQEVNIIKNIEYQLECYKYNSNCRDVNHVLDYNFDNAVIHNTEQVSGNLKLVTRPKNDPISLLQYPLVQQNQITIFCAKEENKYRFNQFWDVTRNRGEFITNYETIWLTEPNGYIKTVNPIYTNYQKNELQRKKFRHYMTKVLLKRLVSGEIKMLLRLSNNKYNKSFR